LRLYVWLILTLVYIIIVVKIETRKNVYILLKQAGLFALQSLDHLLWPAVCINCRQSISQADNHLCGKCWDSLLVSTGGDYCSRCGRDAGRFALLAGKCPDCQGREIYFDCIARAGIYEQNLRQMILSFKNGRTELDSVLGFLADSALQGSNFSSDIELFVPVPLHCTRRFTRGYNQSYILIRKMSKMTAKISTDLVRIRRTKTQPTMVSPAARQKNVAGAFAVRSGHNFRGRNVCLIDDIKTTGATLNECAKTLKQAGASKVFALVLAVAGQKGIS
jgi:competence protein ComFC